MTAAHYRLVGWAFLWLLLLVGVWISWRWALTAVALISLLGLIKRATELKGPRTPE
jgi:hypothetical protein